MNLDKLPAVTVALNRRYPTGNEPFQIMTRLLEEGGELAEQVNHFEGSETKRKKYGEPDRAKMAKEVMDVIRCALQVAMYYGIEKELEMAIDSSYARAKAEGLIE